MSITRPDGFAESVASAKKDFDPAELREIEILRMMVSRADEGLASC
jgi:hypothetical protein